MRPWAPSSRSLRPRRGEARKAKRQRPASRTMSTAPCGWRKFAGTTATSSLTWFPLCAVRHSRFSARLVWPPSGFWRFPLRRSTAKAILTDGHFWIPLSVLVLGVLLLIYVH